MHLSSTNSSLHALVAERISMRHSDCHSSATRSHRCLRMLQQVAFFRVNGVRIEGTFQMAICTARLKVLSTWQLSLAGDQDAVAWSMGSEVWEVQHWTWLMLPWDLLIFGGREVAGNGEVSVKLKVTSTDSF